MLGTFRGSLFSFCSNMQTAYCRGEKVKSNTHTNFFTSDKLRLHSCSGTGVCSFLKSSHFISRMFVSNQEFIIAIKIRVKAPLQLILPSTCTCSSSLDDFGSQLFKCRIGGEWDRRNSVFVHLIASICTSVHVQLPVQHFHSKTLVLSVTPQALEEWI